MAVDDDESVSETQDYLNIATQVRAFVQDGVNAALPRARVDQIQRDIELQRRRLGFAHPAVIGTVLWSGMLSAAVGLGASTADIDEEDWKSSVMTLIPFFDCLASRFDRYGYRQEIQVLQPGEHVDVDSDIIVIPTKDYLQRTQAIETKFKNVPSNRVNGYRWPPTIDQSLSLTALTASETVRLRIGSSSALIRPFPPHLAHDGYGLANFNESCLCGTPFFERAPTRVKAARLQFGMCAVCGSKHQRTFQECLDYHSDVRAGHAPSYVLETVSGRQYFTGPFLPSTMASVSTYYEEVYPGSYFPFSRVPPAISRARLAFEVCTECGLWGHSPGTSLHSACPYNLERLGEVVVEEFYRVVAMTSDPPINRFNGRVV